MNLLFWRIRYEGSTHATHGYIILFFSLSMSFIDLFALIRRLIVCVKSGHKLTLRVLWRVIILGKEDVDRTGSEYMELVANEPEEFENSEVSSDADRVPTHRERVNERYEVDRQNSSLDASSGRTLFDSSRSPTYDNTTPVPKLDPIHTSKAPLLRRIGRSAFSISKRILIVAGLAQVISGIVIYTGELSRVQTLFHSR